jgi:hypothetical protein
MVSFTPQPLYPWKIVPGTHCIGGWVGTRAGQDAVEKRKSLAPAVNRTPAVQPASRRYTDWANPTIIIIIIIITGCNLEESSKEGYGSKCAVMTILIIKGTAIPVTGREDL